RVACGLGLPRSRVASPSRSHDVDITPLAADCPRESMARASPVAITGPQNPPLARNRRYRRWLFRNAFSGEWWETGASRFSPARLFLLISSVSNGSFSMKAVGLDESHRIV